MQDLTLYLLAEQYQAAGAALGDLDLPDDVVADTLDGLAGALEDKAVNVAKFAENLDVTANAIKEAEQRMAKRRKAVENRARRLREYLKSNMEASGITSIESPWFRLAIQKNPPAVEIIDEADLPSEYIKEVVTTKIDKPAIKEAIRNGQEVAGAQLMQSTRLAIR